MKLLVCLITLQLALAGASYTAAQDNSRFQRIVSGLPNNTESTTTVLGQSALAMLVEVYLAEADLARREHQEVAEGLKLVHWAAAVELYARQLGVMLAQIESGAPVEVRLASSDLAVVVVAGRSVMLTHPRADQQKAFEHRLVADFCKRQDCQALSQPLEAAAAVPVSAPVVTPDWSFTPGGPLCSSQAIQIQFSASGELARYRGLCRQFFQEVSSLATEVRWQRTQGVHIDWYSMTIQQTPHRPEHIVTLTSTGEVTLLPLPLLYSSKGLLPALLPWLRARAAGDAKPALLLDAQTYHWN